MGTDSGFFTVWQRGVPANALVAPAIALRVALTVLFRRYSRRHLPAKS